MTDPSPTTPDAGHAPPPDRPASTVLDWIRRYGPAECAGITCAFLASAAVRRATGNAIAAAYAAAWGESLGYIAVMVVRDLRAGARAAHATGGAFRARGAGGVLLGLLAEFGPAGLLDTFITRPLAMGLGVRWFGPRLGVLAGKLGADVLFYVPVLLVYERRKRRRRSAAGL